MKHYELIKLRAGADVIETQEKIWKALEKLEKRYDWLNFPEIRRDLNKDAAWTFMTVVDLDGEEYVDAYLADEIYQKLLSAVGANVIARSTFDHF